VNTKEQIILLVEDDEDDQFFMKIALDKAGIHDPLQIANNGREAIAYLSGGGEFADRRHFPLPTVIFLDLKMPYVTGFDVLEWLRSRGDEFAGIPVIVLTSSPEQRDQTRACELGARSYLLKPPTREMLLDVWKTLTLGASAKAD
jgi:CheY-like chemotaxis protein